MMTIVKLQSHRNNHESQLFTCPARPIATVNSHS